MLFGTTGVIRSGKTTNDTVLCCLEAEDTDSEVYANYHVNHPRVHYLATPDEFTELEFDEMNGLCVLQETQVWFESRASKVKEVTAMVDKTVLQSGKLGFDILWDAQLASSVDKRLRFMTLNWFATRRKITKPDLKLRYVYLNEKNQAFKYNFTGKEFEKTVFPLFNTRELGEMKRKWEINGRPEGIEKTQTILSSPDLTNEHNAVLPPKFEGDIEKVTDITPLPEHGLNIDDLLKMKKSGVEILV